MEEQGIRINKFLSEAGVCSRREADRRIEAKEVTIDGAIACTGDRVKPGQKVEVGGVLVSKEEEMILIALNKPAGIVCTAEKREKDNVIDYLNYPKRIYPIGRLDKDSEGLLLLTNNGDIVNKMMRAGNMHEKEYIVTVNRPISEGFLRGMAGGVPLVELNTTTRPCHVKQLGKRSFKIILTQGLNRQIRRMCEYFGYRVEKLVRVRIMNIELQDLPVGEYRDVTAEEIATLNRMIADSSNQPVRPNLQKRNDSKAYRALEKERIPRERREVSKKESLKKEYKKKDTQKKNGAPRIYTVVNNHLENKNDR